MEMRMELAQKQILSQRMVQSMEILQLSAQELEEYIEKLSMENPVIEIPEPGERERSERQEELQRKLDWLESTDRQNRVYYQQDRAADNMRDNWQDNTQKEELLEDYLFSQLAFQHFDDREKKILEFLILSLDQKGYFTETLTTVTDHFGVPLEEAERLLKVVQSLDPAGVGARTLRECLLLQLERSGREKELVAEIVDRFLPEVAKNHLREIAKKLKVSVQEVQEACVKLRELNPKPGNSFASREQLRYISPDAVVVKLEGQFEILINEYQYPQFSVSEYYQNMLRTTADAEAKKYLQEKIQQANWVADCIAQRSSTLSRVMKEIVTIQEDFFRLGPGHKRPMRLADLSERLNLHESTISRAMKGKYLQCSFGVFPLNYFLTSVAVTAADSGEEKTPEQVKQMIQRVVDEEDKKKPLSDQAISNKLAEAGVSISRRTVNKYRTEMGLPDKSGRKEWRE